MPAAPPGPRAQTIKQAKASYKARGRPSLSEADKRKLERAAELDRRAWRLKEAEKRKIEAAKKRLEKELKDREEAARAPLGSQRRIGRFGHLSSQMHLGAFMRKPAHVKAVEQKENIRSNTVQELDEFGDDALDDASLLNTLDGTSEAGCEEFLMGASSKSSGITSARTFLTPANTLTIRRIPPRPAAEESFDDFFDELGSGTQIARELEMAQPIRKQLLPSNLTPATTSSNMPDLGDFDLTVEDLQELDSLPVTNAAKNTDKRLMPPPPLPKLMHSAPKVASLHGPPSVVEHSFTLSQLEEFVDDDLQLTQVALD